MPRRVRLVKGVLRFRVEVARRGKLTVRLDTRPRVRRVLTLRAGRSTVRLRVPRRARLARRGNRLSLSFADGTAAKPATAVKRVVLRRAQPGR